MLFYVVLTAILSCALTLGVAALYFRNVAEPRLRASYEEQIEHLGDLVQERVRAGVLDALNSVAKGDPLVKATRTVTRTGASLVEEGLNVLLGGGVRPRDKDR
jgi:hypothetical protein